jgi:gluconolactonase
MPRAPLPLIRCLLCVAALACQGWSDEHDDLPPADAVDPELYATGFETAEGPALDPAGNLYVANYRGNGNIGRITPDGKASVLCRLDQLFPVEGRQPHASGLKIDSEGRLIAADSGCGRLLRIAADGSEGEVLADRCESVRFNSIGDVALDLAGNIYFTNPGGSTAEEPVGTVYRYDINTKKVSQLIAGLAFPNGIAVAPEQGHLCVGDSLESRILIYELAEDGAVTNGRTLIQFAKEPSGEEVADANQPGGIVFDTQGRLYVADAGGSTIDVVDVDQGRVVRRYGAGGSRVTNCHFYGPYLYATVAANEAVFRLKLDVLGFDYAGP